MAIHPLLVRLQSLDDTMWNHGSSTNTFGYVTTNKLRIGYIRFGKTRIFCWASNKQCLINSKLKTFKDSMITIHQLSQLSSKKIDGSCSVFGTLE